jgi:soluble lytic murein transglycosylase-like protein
MRAMKTAVVAFSLAITGLGAPAPAVAQYDYERAIYDACATYGCDPEWLINVMYCESNGNPNAVGNHGEIGLFQIKPWIWTEVDPWDPYASIDFAARMFASGQSYYWTCA